MPGLGEFAAVAAGGAIGAVMRFGALLASTRLLPAGFPWGTLLVNVSGSLLMGVAYVLLLERGVLPPVWRSFLTAGVLGAFTTFSAFSMDALALLQAGAPGRALAYVLASVGVCLMAAALGVMMARAL